MLSTQRDTIKILLGMILGVLVGLALQYFPVASGVKLFLSEQIFATLGQIFLRLIKMLVVPIVLVSLICGVTHLKNVGTLGWVGIKALLLYLLTTALAIAIALAVADFFQVGQGLQVAAKLNFTVPPAPNVKEVLLDLFPANPIRALADGNMLQIIVFALMAGVAMVLTHERSRGLIHWFEAANEVLMRMITMIMALAPFGVFFLLAGLFANLAVGQVVHLLSYCLVVVAVLVIQFFVVYGSLLLLFLRRSPLWFLQNAYPAMLFAFGVSSSNASIPVTLKTTINRLQASESTASFVVPLGATINMDGTAIMQGVATVFIAHAYHITLGLSGYLTVIAMATLASIGTAGVPGVGLITLAMVLQQVGLPVEGIALIIGVDRVLDMLRTSVNVAGDMTVALVVGGREDAGDKP